MAWTKEELLVKVRALIAKGNSTEFEEERKLFLAKADELMEKYAISEAMLAQTDEKKSKLVVRRDMDISWWRESKVLDWEIRQLIYQMWYSVSRHCRCTTTASTWDYIALTAAVYGIPSDLDYFDLLFTDLFVQMFSTLRPKYDPAKTLGHNVALAKQAGMKYKDIAVWAGMPELVKCKNGKQQVDGKLLRAYKKYVKEHGGDIVSIHPTTWAISFVHGYVYTIQKRLREIQEGRETAKGDNPMALALRDVADLAKEALWNDFPDLRPHPDDCDCDACHTCDDPKCKRPNCRAARSRRMPARPRERQHSWVAQSRGSQAGQSARIVSNDPSLRSRRGIEG